MMVVGCDAAHNRRAVSIASRYEGIYASVGFQPHDAKDLSVSAYQEMTLLAKDPSVKAIGEIGLDFYRDLSPRDVQKEAFRRQIQLAKVCDLPIILHSRDSDLEVMEILREEGIGRRGGVMHCFSGDFSFAKNCLDLGLFIGVGGSVTFKRNTDLREVIKKIPVESVLIETDCPYITPEPFRGRRNEPAFVAKVAEKLAGIWGISLEETAEKTTANARRFFGI